MNLVWKCHYVSSVELYGNWRKPLPNKTPSCSLWYRLRHIHLVIFTRWPKKMSTYTKMSGRGFVGDEFCPALKLFVWIIVKCTTVNDVSSQNADYNVRDYFCVVIWHCFVTNVIRVDSIVTSNKTSNLQRNTVITSTSSYCKL